MSAVGSILTNTGALQALNSLAATTNTNNNLESQLSSGLAINTPANNPAGYITAQGFTSQLNGLTQAISNANQGVALLQTAQGAITQQIGVVQQLNSIAVEAANGTQTAAEAQSLQTLVGQLNGQVNTIAQTTQFNNINLLNGGFSGIQFQVGANEGQTNTLSISNLAASAIGLNATAAYTGVYTTALATGSAIVKSGSAGALATGVVKLTGPTGGYATFTNTQKYTSAYTLAAQVNTLSATTGVQAQATNTVTFNVAATAAFAFTIQAGTSNGTVATAGLIGTAQTINAQSAAQIVSQINGATSTSGITASLNSANQLVLTQAAGDNIFIATTAVGGTLTTTATSGSIAIGGATTTTYLIQGQVQLQSSGAFSASGATTILGQTAASTLTALSAINVSTTSGANTAINIVKYALATLNNQGGQLGAVQQAFQANINNLSTTSQNLTTALGVVQDANIPAVSTQLTQSQIQAQSGVAALKVSTQLQQAYLSLLP
jgi:flagellin